MDASEDTSRSDLKAGLPPDPSPARPYPSKRAAKEKEAGYAYQGQGSGSSKSKAEKARETKWLEKGLGDAFSSIATRAVEIQRQVLSQEGKDTLSRSFGSNGVSYNDHFELTREHLSILRDKVVAWHAEWTDADENVRKGLLTGPQENQGVEDLVAELLEAVQTQVQEADRILQQVQEFSKKLMLYDETQVADPSERSAQAEKKALVVNELINGSTMSELQRISGELEQQIDLLCDVSKGRRLMQVTPHQRTQSGDNSDQLLSLRKQLEYEQSEHLNTQAQLRMTESKNADLQAQLERLRKEGNSQPEDELDEARIIAVSTLRKETDSRASPDSRKSKKSVAFGRGSVFPAPTDINSPLGLMIEGNTPTPSGLSVPKMIPRAKSDQIPTVQPRAPDLNVDMDSVKANTVKPRKLRVYPSQPSPAQITAYMQYFLPRISLIVGRIARDTKESWAADLVALSPEPENLSILITCTSTTLARTLLRKHVPLGDCGFEYRFTKGSVLRSKPRHHPIHAPYQKTPICGASMSAIVENQLLPPVSLGGVVKIGKQKTYGITVHHMLTTEDDDQESGATESSAGQSSSTRSQIRSKTVPTPLGPPQEAQVAGQKGKNTVTTKTASAHRSLGPLEDPMDDVNMDDLCDDEIFDEEEDDEDGAYEDPSDRDAEEISHMSPAQLGSLEEMEKWCSNIELQGGFDPNIKLADIEARIRAKPIPYDAPKLGASAKPAPQATAVHERINFFDLPSQGDCAGHMPGKCHGIVVLQPGWDDTPPHETDAWRRGDRHRLTLGQLHASSGLRRVLQKRIDRSGDSFEWHHEIDWSVIEIKEDRLHPHNVVQGDGNLCQACTVSPDFLDEGPSEHDAHRAYGRENDIFPTDWLRMDELFEPMNRPVFSYGRTGKLAQGFIEKIPGVFSLPGRNPESQSHAVRICGNMGKPGDSGTWVIDRQTGKLCGAILAHHSRTADMSYFTPIELIFEDMRRKLGKEVSMPPRQQKLGKEVSMPPRQQNPALETQRRQRRSQYALPEYDHEQHSHATSNLTSERLSVMNAAAAPRLPRPGQTAKPVNIPRDRYDTRSRSPQPGYNMHKDAHAHPAPAAATPPAQTRARQTAPISITQPYHPHQQQQQQQLQNKQQQQQQHQTNHRLLRQGSNSSVGTASTGTTSSLLTLQSTAGTTPDLSRQQSRNSLPDPAACMSSSSTASHKSRLAHGVGHILGGGGSGNVGVGAGAGGGTGGVGGGTGKAPGTASGMGPMALRSGHRPH